MLLQHCSKLPYDPFTMKQLHNYFSDHRPTLNLSSFSIKEFALHSSHASYFFEICSLDSFDEDLSVWLSEEENEDCIRCKSGLVAQSFICHKAFTNSLWVSLKTPCPDTSERRALSTTLLALHYQNGQI